MTLIIAFFLMLSLVATWCGLSCKMEISDVSPDVMLYYYGLGILDLESYSIFGRVYYKTVTMEGSAGYYITDIRSVGINHKGGLCSYKGFYANGQLKEEGEIFVEYTNYPKQPYPDRHDVWNGKYYKPDGTLGSEISQGTGTQKLWYPNGQLRWELELRDGNRAWCKQYSEDGKVVSDVEYVDGKAVYRKAD